MPTALYIVELARDLAKIASETREPDTAIKLIALVNKILTASGDMPNADPPGSAEGGGRMQ
jgi:hypothetical protein